MFILSAPYPGPQVTLLMPSPNWGDSIAPTSSVQTMRMMDGTRYTYATSRDGRKRRQWDFRISRAKALELQAFYKVYHRIKVSVKDHDNEIYIGYFSINPLEFTGSGRAVGWPDGETMDVSIELEESSE